MDVTAYLAALVVALLGGVWVGEDRASLVLADSHAIPTERYYDKVFPSVMEIGGRNVTCGEYEPNKAYAGETWTCKDMRIDGKRLGFHHIPGFGANPQCAPEDKMPGHNDLSSLCEALLRRQQVDTHGHLTVLIREANCVQSSELRVIFNSTEHGHVWGELEQDRGYVITLSCMIMP